MYNCIIKITFSDLQYITAIQMPLCWLKTNNVLAPRVRDTHKWRSSHLPAELSFWRCIAQALMIKYDAMRPADVAPQTTTDERTRRLTVISLNDMLQVIQIVFPEMHNLQMAPIVRGTERSSLPILHLLEDRLEFRFTIFPYSQSGVRSEAYSYCTVIDRTPDSDEHEDAMFEYHKVVLVFHPVSGYYALVKNEDVIINERSLSRCMLLCVF